MNHECPICKKHDATARVSAIVVGGMTHTSQSNVGFSFSFQEGDFNVSPSWSDTATLKQTELSKTLAFKVKRNTLLIIWGWILLGVAPIGIANVPIALFASTGMPDNVPFKTVKYILIGLCFLAGSICLSESKPTKQENEQAKATWQELYYCLRDDIVYNPNNPSQYGPRLQMRELLYRKP